MPTARSVSISKPLTNLAVAYKPPDLLGPGACPTVKVPQEDGKYFKFGFEDLQPITDIIGDKSEASVLEWDVTTASYSCVPRAVRTFVPDRVMRNADAVVRPMITATQRVVRALLMNREIRISAAYLAATASYATDIAAAWATASSATPYEDIVTEKGLFYEQCGRQPNTLILTQKMADAMVVSAEWKDFVKYTHSDLIQNGHDLPPTIAGMKVLITGARYSSDDELTTLSTTMPTTVSIWGGAKGQGYLAYLNPRPAIEDASFMHLLEHLAFRVRKYRDEKVGLGGGTWIQAEYSAVPKVINTLMVRRLQDTLVT